MSFEIQTWLNHRTWLEEQMLDRDGSFGDVLRHSSHLLPDWFQEIIKKVNVKVWEILD